MRKSKWLVLALALLLVPGFAFAQVYDYLHPRKDSFGYVGTADETYKEGHFEQFIMPEITDPGTPGANIGWLYVKDNGAGTTQLIFETSAGASILGPAGFTAWDDVDDPDADSSISAGNYESTITSTINSADKATLNLVNTTADLTADVSLLELRFTDDGDVNGFFIRGYDNAGADLRFSIGADGAFILGSITGRGALTVATPAGAALTLAADDGNVAAEDVIIIGNNIAVDSSGNTTLGGTLSVGSTLTFSGSSDAISATSWSISDAGAAVFTSVNAGTWKQNAVVAKDANTTITIDGTGIGGVTIGATSTGTITLGGGAVLVNLPAATDMTLSGGTITMTDTGNGPILSATNNSLTATNLVTLSGTALTSAKGISLTVTGMTTGTGLYIGATEATLTSGKYIQCYDGAADDFSVAKYGATTIAGTASGTAALTLTTGDLVISSGKLTQAGGAVLINNDSNYTIGIGTGTNTQAITIGGGANTVAINSSDWDISATGVVTGIASIAMDAAAADITLTAGGAAQDFTIQVAGAQDASLILKSSGTGNDALQIKTTAGGMDISVTGTTGGNENLDILSNTQISITAQEEVADQIKLSAQGSVAGDAINIATLDGGIILTALGGSGNITLNPDGNLNSTIGGNLILSATGTGAISTIDWAISATGAVTNLASVGFDSGSVVYVDTVSITSAQVKALAAAPKQLVAAPGANKFVQVISAALTLDYGTNVFTCGAGDDLVIQYNTSGSDISGTIETTGWIDQAAHTTTLQPPPVKAAIASANMINKAVELFNVGAEIGGNAAGDNVVRVQITYIIHSMTL